MAAAVGGRIAASGDLTVIGSLALIRRHATLKNLAHITCTTAPELKRVRDSILRFVDQVVGDSGGGLLIVRSHQPSTANDTPRWHADGK